MSDFFYYFVMIVCIIIVNKVVNRCVNSIPRKSPKFVIVKTIGQTGNNHYTNVLEEEITTPNDKKKPTESPDPKTNNKPLKEIDLWPEDNELSIPDARNVSEVTAFVSIFNQQNFVNPKHNRLGSDNDVNLLEQALLQYNVKPEVNQNLTLKEIACKMKVLSKTDFLNCKLYMSIFLSHGTTNGIVSAKDKTFDHHRLIDPIMMNESLSNVPKIFIFLACRGRGTYRESSDFSDGSHIVNSDDGISYRNCMKCYSTYEGQESYRKGDGTGSYYITEFCQLITNFPMESFHNIMAKLNDRLKLKQTPVLTTTLGEFSLNDIK